MEADSFVTTHRKMRKNEGLNTPTCQPIPFFFNACIFSEMFLFQILKVFNPVFATKKRALQSTMQNENRILRSRAVSLPRENAVVHLASALTKKTCSWVFFFVCFGPRAGAVTESGQGYTKKLSQEPP